MGGIAAGFRKSEELSSGTCSHSGFVTKFHERGNTPRGTISPWGNSERHRDECRRPKVSDGVCMRRIGSRRGPVRRSERGRRSGRSSRSRAATGGPTRHPLVMAAAPAAGPLAPPDGGGATPPAPDQLPTPPNGISHLASPDALPPGSTMDPDAAGRDSARTSATSRTSGRPCRTTRSAASKPC